MDKRAQGKATISFYNDYPANWIYLLKEIISPLGANFFF